MDSNTDPREDFRNFCRNATDAQLENVLHKEWMAAREDYWAAIDVARERSWEVINGRRVG